MIGERHWPKVKNALDPPPIKIGLGRPKKNRRKNPLEDPKKPGKLTRHGIKLSYSLCKAKDHTKRTCSRRNDPAIEPPTKRLRGRPRNQDETFHHSTTTQPTNRGRGRVGRGQGRRGRARSSQSQGRGRGRIPVGVGIYVDDRDSTSYTNTPSQGCPPINLSVMASTALIPSSQTTSISNLLALN